MYIYLVVMEKEDGEIESIDSAHTSYDKAESRVQEILSHSVSLYASIKEVQLEE